MSLGFYYIKVFFDFISLYKKCWNCRKYPMFSKAWIPYHLKSFRFKLTQSCQWWDIMKWMQMCLQNIRQYKHIQKSINYEKNKVSFLKSQESQPTKYFNFKVKSKCISYFAKYNKYSLQYNPNMRVNNYLAHLLYDNMWRDKRAAVYSL